MLRQRQTMICVEGWSYLVVLGFVLAGALLREINLLIILFGMLAGPLLFSWRLVRASIRKIDVRRKLPLSVSAGDLLIVELEGSSTGRRIAGWAVTATDSICREGSSSSSPPVEASVLLPHIPPGGSAKASYRGRLFQRGRYRLGPLRISTRFPLGLIRHTVRLDHFDTLVVYPRMGQLNRDWKRLQQSADLGTGTAERQQGTLEGDFFGLRDWRQGDRRRWIHWRTSARRQSLLVRQFEQQRNQDLALLVDLWQPGEASDEAQDNVELAVSFAATVAAEACRQGGASLCLGIAGVENRLAKGPGSPALLSEIMEALAVAEAGPRDSLVQVVQEVLDSIRPGTRLLLISSRPVDLTARQRFGTLWDQPRLRPWLGRVQCIDASSSALDKMFTSAS